VDAGQRDLMVSQFATLDTQVLGAGVEANPVMAAVERLSNQEVQGRLAHLSEKLAGLRGGGSGPRPAVPQRLRARRPGWVLSAIVQVLVDKGAPMRAKDIHAAVAASLGEPVAWSSIRTALASHASGSSPRVVRIARGRYALCDPLV
jgi:hypothetical protein